MVLSRGTAAVWFGLCAGRCTSALKVRGDETPLPASRADSECECLSWKKAFTDYGANCDKAGEDICGLFVARLPDEKFCMNSFVGMYHPQQWCYVSANCESGNKLDWAVDSYHGRARWKQCDTNQRFLGDTNFTDLHDWSVKNNLDIGMVAQFAFPTWDWGELQSVMNFFDAHMPPDAPWKEDQHISEEDRQRLQAMVDSGASMFYASRTSHPPFGVSEGKKFYYINHGVSIANVVMAGGAFHSQPNKINDVVCAGGCGNASKPTWWEEWVNK